MSKLQEYTNNKKVKVSKDDAEKIVALFFNMIDSIYGSGLHHIGDGDSIDPMTADDIKEMYNKYALDYFVKHSIQIIEE
jgi:hypothetical protein